MKMSDFLTLIYRSYGKIHNRQGRVLKHRKSQIESYINSFHEPTDDFERSYFQYKCQKWDSMGKGEFIISNIVSLFLFIPYYIMFRLKKVPSDTGKYDAVLTVSFLENILPDDFHGTYIWQNFNKGSLSRDDTKLIKRLIKRYPTSFYFNFKVMCRIASYSNAILKYSPEIFFSSAEYSFTSSILTYYCEMHGVKHYNIMHGEKGYTPRDAFSRFTKFFVWDMFYKELFLSLRADRSEYVIRPMKIPEMRVNVKENHITYYLQLHTIEQLYKIKESLEKSRIDYHVRVHPLFSGHGEEEVFGSEHIESSSVGIWESIGNAGIAASQDSTVLYQAYLAGVPVAIDDVSDSSYFLHLKERGYIMFYKPHHLLSELISTRG